MRRATRSRARGASSISRSVEASFEAIAFGPACAGLTAASTRRSSPPGVSRAAARAVDLMIAATALAHDLPLYTRNAKDLRGLEELIEIVDVSA